ncbi:MAG TPA: nuclear transport factor 2 family protein, partial [Terriglobales bacterium]|nr:nuclear transport factor 2 family protein [Terriglobales bacterium]
YLENGDEVRVRGIWSPMGSNVRETAVTSSDAGKTWKPWFDLVFRPRKEATGSDGQEDDATAVARLDDAYQAAVKQNDAEQIDHILSDDFVLVTGSGKIVNKQAILEEARSRTTIYEHQEDSERTVRLLGDTALVTARLRVKGVRNDAPIDYSVWFTDVYRRTANGWRYVFGQASLPLPKQP